MNTWTCDLQFQTNTSNNECFEKDQDYSFTFCWIIFKVKNVKLKVNLNKQRKQ